MHLKDLERQLVKLRMENSNNHAPFTYDFPVNLANFLGPNFIVDRRKPHCMAVMNHASASRSALIRYKRFFFPTHAVMSHANYMGIHTYGIHVIYIK